MISFVICLKEIFIGSVFMLIYCLQWHMALAGGGGGGEGGTWSYVCVQLRLRSTRVMQCAI